MENTAIPGSSKRPFRLVLTFDVEEFDLPLEYGASISPGSQIETGAAGWEKVLGLLEELDIPATLFTTAHIAESRPDLLLRSVRGGHEIASHNLRHAPGFPPRPAEARNLLRELCGQEIAGYRSPRFAPVADYELIEAGHSYNSSLNPVWMPGRYNHFRAPRGPHRRNSLLQFPLSATPVLRIPLFWLAFKVFPPPLFRLLCEWTLHADGYLHLYFHPWEFCDLSREEVPAFLRRPDGDRLLMRLRHLLRGLEKRARAVTAGEFLAETKQW